MHYADVTDNGDGTFSSDCYCGYVQLGFPSLAAAEADAERHQNTPDFDDDSELIIG